MKISEVKTYLIHAPIPETLRVESGAGLKLARQMCLVEIKTGEGISGYASASGPYDLSVLERIIQAVIAPYLLGACASDIGHLWHRLYYGEISRNLGNRGIGIAALSSIDVALWDLKGREARMPLWQLFGGRYHPDGVRAYASSIYWDLTPAEAAGEAARHVEKGFSAVKIKVGKQPREDLVRLEEIRKALGSQVEILVDANQSLGRMDALRMLAALEDNHVYWFEEPLAGDDIEGHRMLREARRGVRIAAGENLYTRFSFAEFVRQGALDVLQADVCRAGGFTEVRKIAGLASAYNLDWNPHTFNDILTTVANLHLVMASPHPAMFECDITHNDLMTGLILNPPKLEAGKLTAPAGPGLGVEINWDFVFAHPWKGEPTIGPGYGMRL